MSPGPLQSDSLPYLMACQVVHPLQWLLFNHSSSQCGPITTADPNPHRRIPCTPTSLLWDSAVCTSQFGQPCLDLNVDKGGWSLLEAHASVYRSLQSRWPAFRRELPRDTYCSACRSTHTCWRYHSCGMNDAMLLVSSQLMKSVTGIFMPWLTLSRNGGKCCRALWNVHFSCPTWAYCAQTWAGTRFSRCWIPDKSVTIASALPALLSTKSTGSCQYRTSFNTVIMWWP